MCTAFLEISHFHTDLLSPFSGAYGEIVAYFQVLRKKLNLSPNYQIEKEVS